MKYDERDVSLIGMSLSMLAAACNGDIETVLRMVDYLELNFNDDTLDMMAERCNELCILNKKDIVNQ